MCVWSMTILEGENWLRSVVGARVGERLTGTFLSLPSTLLPIFLSLFLLPRFQTSCAGNELSFLSSLFSENWSNDEKGEREREKEEVVKLAAADNKLAHSFFYSSLSFQKKPGEK